MEYPPHGNPGSMLDTTKRSGLEVTNLQPSARGKRSGPPAAQALARLKGKKKKRPPTAKRKRLRLVGAARAGSGAATTTTAKRKKRGAGTRLNGAALEALRGTKRKG